ncbi:glycerol-3-phosphate dehydrogenase/oxidase [Arthrobacter sp. HMSC08H08]|uniref:glycerol-3-phosphate dehydrogenase/oxidase n=1 Tax=Arthrobacter sp. HMSC08H08 TaxID=1581143 RepID=UPI00114D2728|nr:glycerol-3-phosphate dehydrogenase/oxidase [Arthrobacter sp. HMSC08H08]
MPEVHPGKMVGMHSKDHHADTDPAGSAPACSAPLTSSGLGSAPVDPSSSLAPPLNLARGRHAAGTAPVRASVQRIAQRPETDVLILGGGINGAAAARELALQGIDVVLAEAHDFAYGASGASSHMIHGGIRYLEYGEFRLVKESVQERNRLLRHAGHRVRPLPTFIPLRTTLTGLLNAPLRFLFKDYRGVPAERGALMIKAGLVLYDTYSRASRKAAGLKRHSFLLGRQAVRRAFPDLRPDTRFVAQYQDAQVESPERLIIDLLSEAEDHGARIANQLALTGTTASTIDASDGITLTDQLTGQHIQVRPRVIINATGSWVDLTNRDLGHETSFMGGTKGAHLVLDHPQLLEACRGGEIFFEHQDGRIVLICPLGERVLVGTTDLPADPGEVPECSDEEYEYLLELVQDMFPTIPISEEHVVHTFAGVRPLPRSNADATGAITRDHHIVHLSHSMRGTRNGRVKSIEIPLLCLVGGKLTTFRAVGEQLTDQALDQLDRDRIRTTRGRDIKGMIRGDDPTKDCEAVVGSTYARALVKRYGSYANEVADFIAHLIDSGTDPDAAHPLAHTRELLRGEVAWMAEREHATNAEDILRRRTNLRFNGIVRQDTALSVEAGKDTAAQGDVGEDALVREIEEILEASTARA